MAGSPLSVSFGEYRRKNGSVEQSFVFLSLNPEPSDLQAAAVSVNC